MSGTSDQGFAGYQDPQDVVDESGAQEFLINSIVGRLATTMLVKVMAVTTTGAVAPVGFVDVTPMVNQIDGVGNPTPHTTIHNLPHFRLQGGANAVIIDPVVGDIGFAVFCSRDISTAKRTKATANPGSLRRHDWADGLYVGGVLNAAPTQYVQFNTSGITIQSPTQITLTAPNITINGTTAVAINGPTTVDGNVSTTGTLTNNGHAVGSTHEHTNSGGTGIGGPPV